MNHELSRDGAGAAQFSDDFKSRLEFETLLLELSSGFINLPAEQVDHQIQHAQQLVCEFLGVDLSSLWQWRSEDSRMITLTHLYRRLGGPPIPDPMDGEKYFPWTVVRLREGKPVILSSLAELPAAADRDREVYAYHGNKAILLIPLSVVGGPVLGCLSFNDLKTERRWPTALVQRLQLVAQIFANALARKAVDQALRARQERLAAAVEVADLGFYELYGVAQQEFFDGLIRSILGLPDGAAPSAREFWVAHLHPEDRERIIELSRQVFEGPLNHASAEYRYLHPQRGTVWLRQISRVFERDAQGRMVRLTGVMQDITQRKTAEEKVSQLSHAMEQSSVLITITDQQGKIIYVNRKFTEVTGYSLEECLGQNPRILKSGESSPAVYQELWAAITAGRTWRGEFHNRKKNGELYWESAVISPLRDPAGSITHFVAVKEDITGRKRTELEILQQRNQLTHLSRVTMLGELAGSLAHELNQPLTSILSNAQAAQRFLAHGEPDLGEIRDILADIVAEDKRAGEVIRRLRLLLKKGEVQRQPLLVNEIVQEVLKLVRSDLVNLNLTAQTELAPNLPVVHGDAVQLQQVLLNLVLNSCDAMAGATRNNRQLTIRTSRGEDGSVCLSVVDGGTGIAPEKLEQVFEPFYSTKASGLGLGLAVCRSIVTAHGGKLWATNNPGPGATFHLTLPVRTGHSR